MRSAGVLRLLIVAALGAGGALATAPPTQAATVDASSVDVLPRHYSDQPVAHELTAASPGYVMHGVHDLPWGDGHSHDTILRSSDGAPVWSDFDPSPDASSTGLAGRYFTEKVGDSTYWPTSVRFFDVETHALAGEIPRPANETLGAVGPGWILTSRPDPDHYPDQYLVIHRLDGTTSTLPAIKVDNIPHYFGTDGTYAWVTSQFDFTLYQVDLAAGTAVTVPGRPGPWWSGVLIGPTTIFGIDDQYNGHVTVTAIDRTTGSLSSYDVVSGITGNGPQFVTLGNGLAVWNPYHGTGSTLWKVDLASGALGQVVADHLSDVKQAGPGQVAMIDASRVPGTIRSDDGSGPVAVADLPPVAEGSAAIAFDRTVRSTWEDTTMWTIDPDNPSAGWTQTPFTSQQRITTAGGTVLAEDYNDNGFPSTHWHLSWSGGQRDFEAGSVVLGHGGELLVRHATTGTDGYTVERVSTGQVVASVDETGAVADGSWVWHWSAPGVLTGTDVDHPGTPARTVNLPTNTTLADVRGRWALVGNAGFKVIDLLGVVAPFSVPVNGYNLPSPVLGAGFVVSKLNVYDQWGYTVGTRVIVTDLSPTHDSRDVVDPVSGKAPWTFAVDEAGSHALAYVDNGGLPKVLRLPWLKDAPLTQPDTAPPVVVNTTGTPAVVSSYAPSTVHQRWEYADQGVDPWPATGVASYTVRWRVRTGTGDFGAWTTATTSAASTTAATVDQPVDPGQELCAQASATDAVGNTSAWSDPRCTRVDGNGPLLAPATGSPRFTTTDAQGTLDYEYGATSDYGVAAYQVQARSAAPGADLGPWMAAGISTTATSLHQPASPGSEWCFRFAARDTAGTPSNWSSARCSTVAIQDTNFYSPHHSSRRRSRFALDGSYLRLDARGAWLRVKQPQVGHTVAVWAVAGPRQGSADVYAAGIRLGHVALNSTTWHRKLVTFAMPRNGTVKVVQHGRAPVGIDAITVER